MVVDDTGSPRFIRDAWRAIAEDAAAPFVIVWVQIDAALQRERVLANRSEQERHDIIDSVLDDHVASFEAPTDEAPIVIDARETRDVERLREVARGVRGVPLR